MATFDCPGEILRNHNVNSIETVVFLSTALQRQITLGKLFVIDCQFCFHCGSSHVIDCQGSGLREMD